MKRSRLPLRPLSVEYFNKLTPNEIPEEIRECDTKEGKCGVNSKIPKSYKRLNLQPALHWSNPSIKSNSIKAKILDAPEEKVHDLGNVSSTDHLELETVDTSYTSISSTEAVCKFEDISFESFSESVWEYGIDEFDVECEGINAVITANYFSDIWTILEDIFEKEICSFLIASRITSTNDTSPGSANLQDLPFQDPDIMDMVFAGVDFAESESTIDDLFFHTPSLLKLYKSTKNQFLLRLHTENLTPSTSPPPQQQWNFIGLLIIDAILHYTVFPTLSVKATQFISPQRIWIFNFEAIAARMFGGEKLAAEALTLRELILLRRFFDKDLNEDYEATTT